MNWRSLLRPLFSGLRRSPLRRSPHGLLGGICAGIAEETGANVWIVRAVAVGASFLPVIGVGLYAALWALLPDRLGRIHVEDWLTRSSIR